MEVLKKGKAEEAFRLPGSHRSPSVAPFESSLPSERTLILPTLPSTRTDILRCVGRNCCPSSLSSIPSLSLEPYPVPANHSAIVLPGQGYPVRAEYSFRLRTVSLATLYLYCFIKSNIERFKEYFNIIRY